MKFSLTLLLFSGALAVAPMNHAQTASDKPTSEQVKQETRELLDSLKSFAADQKDQAIDKAKSAMSNLDQRIDALESRVDRNWDTMNSAARQKARDTLKTLREQRTRVAEWYGSMKASSADAWDHMKQGFLDAYEALGDAWRKSEDEIGEGG